MSNLPNTEALKEAASILQREEQKVTGNETSPGGPAAKAQSLADGGKPIIKDQPDYSTENVRDINVEAASEAARIIQREENKLAGGDTLPGGAASAAQSFVDKVSQSKESRENQSAE